MEQVKKSNRLVIQRCLNLMGVSEEYDKDEYDAELARLGEKPFTELHELAKRLRVERQHGEIRGIFDSALKTSHSNISR